MSEAQTHKSSASQASLGRDAHVRSQSRQRDPVMADAREYTLQVHHEVFEKFEAHSSKLIKAYCYTQAKDVTSPSARDRDRLSALEEMCGPGADPDFDSILAGLAHISSDRPKELIEKMIKWRNKDHRQQKIDQPISPPESQRPAEPRPRAASNLPSPEPLLASPIHSPAGGQADEWRTRICTYILLRVMAEIFSREQAERLGSDSVKRVQNIIFYHQLVPYSRESGPAPTLDKTAETASKWDIAAEVWGQLSRLNFDHCRDLLLAELRHLQPSVAQKGLSEKNFDNIAEKHLRLLLKGMRHTLLPFNTIEQWIKTCEFLTTIADMFAGVHGQSPKTAYAKFVGQILLPIATKQPTYLDHPSWRSAYQKLHERLSRLANKTKYAHHASTALGVLSCIAPPDIFEVRWREIINGLGTRLREKNTRAVHLKSVCRLLWTRLHRLKDHQASTPSKICEDITKLVFFSGKRYSLSSEAIIVEPLIEILRIVADANQDFCFRSVLWPLLNADAIIGKNNLSINDLEPDRTVIGIKAVLSILDDVERHQRPSFPSHFPDERESSSPSVRTIPNFSKPPESRHERSFSNVREERRSKPFNTSFPTDKVKAFYDQFCQVLERITRVCNISYGGEAVISQQVSSSAAGVVPKSTLVDTNLFRAARDETAADDKASHYELLYTAIKALAKCPSPAISNIEMVTLLCFGVAHSRPEIAQESARSLASIARQGYAHLVVQRFTTFIFNYDTRYSTLSDSGMLGPAFVEQTLGLYLLLLQIWVDEVLSKARAPLDEADKTAPLDTSSTWTLVDRVEAHGLLFLCSPSFRVRAYATQVLELIPKFDDALGETSNVRIYHTLQNTDLSSQRIDRDTLTTYERSLLDRRINKLSDWQKVFIRLCATNEAAECALWNKLFPHIARAINADCPVAVAQTRNDVCARLAQMQQTIDIMGRSSGGAMPQQDLANQRGPTQQLLTFNNITIDQWRHYLTFACATMNSLRAEPRNQSDVSMSTTTAKSSNERVNLIGKTLGDSPMLSSSSTFPQMNRTQTGSGSGGTSSELTHGRSSSKSSAINHDSFDLGNELLARVTPLLHADNPLVRNAASVGLGSINKNLYRPLIEALSLTARKYDEPVERSATVQSPTFAPARRPKFVNNAEVAQVYSLTAHYLREEEFVRDDSIMEAVTNYVKNLFHHLREVEHSLDIWRLRRFACDLIEQTFRATSLLEDKTRYISFQTRKAIFMTLEEWYAGIVDGTEIRGGRISSHEAAAVRKEIGRVNIAALSAMSTLCAGPLSFVIGNVANSFNHERILEWADRLLNHDADKQQKYGQQALVNVILYNRDYPFLLDRVVKQLYTSTKPKATASYLDVLGKVVTVCGSSSMPSWRLLSVLLFVLGHSDRAVRMQAARMIRKFDEADSSNVSKLRDLDISISDKTTVVYKRAQYEIASKLAESHPNMAIQIFSELSQYFIDLNPEYQRNMITVLLPWLRCVELTLETHPSGPYRPTDDSYMVMANLLQITVKCGKQLHTEVQALWQTLVTGDKKGNLKLILDFVMDLCLDRRDQTCLECAKQVVVYLATAKADQQGSDHSDNVISFLILNVKPRAMISETRSMIRSIERKELAHVADLKSVFPATSMNKLSVGQVNLIVLVDLIVLPLKLEVERLLNLLVAVFTLWDQESDFFREQVKEMLVHLIQSLVVSQVAGAAVDDAGHAIEDLIDLIRTHDHRVSWTFREGLTYEAGESLPSGMSYLVPRMLQIFEHSYKTIRKDWASATLGWAVECAVPHLACRSLQLHRCCLQSTTQSELSNILVRLSVTASDTSANLQQYTTELLRVCRQMLMLTPPPEQSVVGQLFWTTCAALDSAKEVEFREALTIMELILPEIHLGDPNHIHILASTCPPTWDWSSHGLTGLIYKGLTSSDSYEKSLAMLNRLAALPSNLITGDSSRMQCVLLANLPSLLRYVGQPRDYPHFSETAKTLSRLCSENGLGVIASMLDKYPRARFKAPLEFRKGIAAALRMTFFPSQGAEVIQFLMMMLSNPHVWIKREILELQRSILADAEARKVDFGGRARSVLWPVYAAMRTTKVMTEALNVIDHVNDLKNDDNLPHVELYGIPAENGWAVPDASSSKLRMRNNLRSLYDQYKPTATDLIMNDNRTPEMGRPDIQITTDTMQSADLMSPDVMMETLDELDDFFDVPDLQGSASLQQHKQQPQQHRRFGSRPSPAALARTQSEGPTHHFQHQHHQQRSQQYVPTHNVVPSANAFASAENHVLYATPVIGRARAGSRPTPPREATTMSPSAFNASPRQQGRPGMAPRSVTSPAGTSDRTPPGSRHMNMPAHSPDYGEPFSDDDGPIGRNSSSDQSSLGNVPLRPSSRSRSAIRNVSRSLSRRFNGGRRTQADESPEVPKVPDHYLQHQPQSSDL